MERLDWNGSNFKWYYYILLVFLIIIIKKEFQCKAFREWFTPYQSRDTTPTIPTYRKQEMKLKIEDKNGANEKKIIGPACKTHHSHTIEYRGSKIVPQRYWVGNKNPAVLLGSTARRRISISMCDQSTACNLHWHIRHWYSTTKRLHRVTHDLIEYTRVLPQIDDAQC